MLKLTGFYLKALLFKHTEELLYIPIFADTH